MRSTVCRASSGPGSRSCSSCDGRSGSCETRSTGSAVQRLETLPVYEELAGFVRALRRIIRRRLRSRTERAAFRYWDSANTVKERYRDQTRLGVAGLTVDLSFREIRGFLADAGTLLDATFRRPTRAQVMSPGGVPYTYFLNEIVKHRPLSRRNPQGFPLVKALGFRQRPVRLFLEGAVHWMKDRPDEAADIYRALRRSGVFDRKLAMYKTSEDMTGETTELGRSVGAYPRGWMENESDLPAHALQISARGASGRVVCGVLEGRSDRADPLPRSSGLRAEYA